jgi:hypothetical protein
VHQSLWSRRRRFGFWAQSDHGNLYALDLTEMKCEQM